MKRINSLSALILMGTTAILFATVGCKKESVVNPAPVPTVTKKLKKSTSVYDNGTPEIEDYTYDAQGRISVFKEDTRTTTFDYVSPTLLVTTERKNSDNSISGTKECQLNANGSITKMIFKDPAGNVVFTYDFSYNADGYITNKKGAYTNGYTTEIVYTISNGNAISAKVYHDNILSNSTEYIYDNSKLNKNAFSYAAYWESNILYGKASKNLSTESKVLNSSGTLTWHSTVTYDLDADGYPIKLIVNNLLTGKQQVDTYIYQ